MKVYIVSDKTEPQLATLGVRLMDFDGKVLLEDKRDVNRSVGQQSLRSHGRSPS